MAPAKKGALRQHPIPVFIDEAGAYLLPSTVRTYAPCGLTPELEVYEGRDHVGITGAIIPAGELFTLTRHRSLNGQDSVRFLQHLHQHIGRPLLVIWDRGPIHRRKEIRQFLSEGGARFIHLEPLPTYAPELNSQEGVWHLLKDVELRNLCCRDLDQLAHELRLAIIRLRRQPGLLLSSFGQAGLQL